MPSTLQLLKDIQNEFDCGSMSRSIAAAAWPHSFQNRVQFAIDQLEHGGDVLDNVLPAMEISTGGNFHSLQTFPAGTKFYSEQQVRELLQGGHHGSVLPR
jgi:hypothetical protein